MNLRTRPHTLDLRHSLIARVGRLRTRLASGCHTRPRATSYDVYRTHGQALRRLRILLRSNGCSVPTCTMCHLPNGALASSLSRVTAAQYIEQVQYALSTAAPCDMLAVYNDGSFFSHHELPDQARNYIYRAARDRCYVRFMIESLPQYIDGDTLSTLRHSLGATIPVVAMGLQSSSATIRELCILSPVTELDFLRAHSLVRSMGCEVKVYLLLKPPFLTEAEAIKDCVASARWLASLGVDDISICPARVESGTVLSDLFTRGLYFPPRLASLAECLRQLSDLQELVRVSISNLLDAPQTLAISDGCPECRTRTLQALTDFNEVPAASHLNDAVCMHCVVTAASMDSAAGYENLSLTDRIANYLETL